VLQDVDPELRIIFIQRHFNDVPIAEIAKHHEIPVGTAKTRLRLARKSVKAAWTRYKARERHAEQRSNVVPILGPLTFMEAGRQVPPLSAERRARIWSGLQAQIGGGGGDEGGDGGPPPSTQRPAFANVPTTARRLLRAALLVGAGLVLGALWDPLHRLRSSSPEPTAPLAPELVAAPAPPTTAPSATPSSSPAPATRSAASTGASAAPPVDVEAALMDRANRALNAGQIDLALSLLQEHATRYQGAGRLAVRRETYWITALLRAGRKVEARARLQAFEARYPNNESLQGFHDVLSAP
jgi:hypothetical protein